MSKKKLGADVPSAGVDRFNTFCGKRGYGRGPTAEAAFILLELAPPDLRDLAMEKNEKAVRKWFDDVLAARLAREVKRALECVGAASQATPSAPPKTAGGNR